MVAAAAAGGSVLLSGGLELLERKRRGAGDGGEGRRDGLHGHGGLGESKKNIT